MRNLPNNIRKYQKKEEQGFEKDQGPLSKKLMGKIMKTVATNNSNSKDPQVDLEFLLRTNGFLFPETVNEVTAYERTFGDTDIILPDDMQEPSFLKEAHHRAAQERDNVVRLHADNCSMAARDEKGNELPDHIKQQMEEDLAKLKR